MIFKVDETQWVDAAPISLRCPACRQLGTFTGFGSKDALIWQDEGATRHAMCAGHRECPNPSCRAHAFVVQEIGGEHRLLVSYPPERIDFDTTDVPVAVVAALKEAIACHASRCFKAAAMLVRKTLEELCRDQSAQGKNLKDRIQDLRAKVVLPEELFNALDDLRLLGNDAAHVESNVYDDVGQDEVEAGVDVAKVVLQAVYQYKSLKQRLDSLKS